MKDLERFEESLREVLSETDDSVRNVIDMISIIPQSVPAMKKVSITLYLVKKENGNINREEFVNTNRVFKITTPEEKENAIEEAVIDIMFLAIKKVKAL